MARWFYIRTAGTYSIEDATAFDLFVDGKEYRDENNEKFNRVAGSGAALHYYYKFLIMMIREGEFSRAKEAPYLVRNKNGGTDPFPRHSVKQKIKPQWEKVFNSTSIRIIDGHDEVGGGNALRKYFLVCNDDHEYIFQINEEIYVLSGANIERVYNYMEKPVDYAPTDDFSKAVEKFEVDPELYPKLKIDNKSTEYKSLKDYYFGDEKKPRILYIDSPRRYGKTYSLCSVALQAYKNGLLINETPSKKSKARETKEFDKSYTVVFLSSNDLLGRGDFNLAEEIFKHSYYDYNNPPLSLLDNHINRSPMPWLILIDDFNVLPIERQNAIIHSLGMLFKDNDNVSAIITSSVPEMYGKLNWNEKIKVGNSDDNSEIFTLREVTARGRFMKMGPDQIPKEVRKSPYIHAEFCTPEFCAYIKKRKQDDAVRDYYDLFEHQYRDFVGIIGDGNTETVLMPLKFLAYMQKEKKAFNRSVFNSLYKAAADYSTIVKINQENNSYISDRLIDCGELTLNKNNRCSFRRYEFSKYLAASFFVDYILSHGVPTDEEEDDVACVLLGEIKKAIRDILPHTGDAYQDFNSEDLARIQKRMDSFLYTEFLFVELYKRVFKNDIKQVAKELAERLGIEEIITAAGKDFEDSLKRRKLNPNQRGNIIQQTLYKHIEEPNKREEDKKKTIIDTFARAIADYLDQPAYYLSTDNELRSYLLILGLFIGFDKGLKAWNCTTPLIDEFVFGTGEKYMDVIQVLNACLYTGIRQTENTDILDSFERIYKELLNKEKFDYTRSTDDYPYLLDEKEKERYIYEPRLLEALMTGNRGALELQKAKLIRDEIIEGTIDDEIEYYKSAEVYHRKGLEIKAIITETTDKEVPVGIVRSYVSLGTDCYWWGDAECRKADENKGNKRAAIKKFKAANEYYDNALALSKKEHPVEDAEPHVLYRRKAGCLLELFDMEGSATKKKEYSEAILACLDETNKCLGYYVSIYGDVNPIALERQRNEIERFVKDLQGEKYKKFLKYLRNERNLFDDHFSFINDILELYNQLHYYEPLTFDLEALKIVNLMEADNNNR